MGPRPLLPLDHHRLVVDLQNCAKAQASRAYANKVKLSNLQQMAQTICYVQEHGYDTKDDMEHDRQMNIAAFNKLANTLRNTDEQISKIEASSDNSEQYIEQLDILHKTREQLLMNQKALQQNIRNMKVVAANVNAILHPTSEHALDKVNVRGKEITQDR